MIDKYLTLTARALKWTCVALILTILVAMSAQIFFRYVLSLPLSHSDEIAQTALTWLTFLGSAWAYREARHIEVDLISHIHNPALQRIRDVIVQLIVIACMSLLAFQVIDIAPLMIRLKVGTMQISRFYLHFLPLIISCGLITIFALSRIINGPPKASSTEETS